MSAIVAIESQVTNKFNFSLAEEWIKYLQVKETSIRAYMKGVKNKKKIILLILLVQLAICIFPPLKHFLTSLNQKIILRLIPTEKRAIKLQSVIQKKH